MSRGRWKREHELPRFPFHCYTNPRDASGETRVKIERQYLLVFFFLLFSIARRFQRCGGLSTSHPARQLV
jgi:hypothetical protein